MLQRKNQEIMLDGGEEVKIRIDEGYFDDDGQHVNAGAVIETNLRQHGLPNQSVDSIESLLLALAGQGFLVPDHILKNALQQTLDAIGNRV